VLEGCLLLDRNFTFLEVRPTLGPPPEALLGRTWPERFPGVGTSAPFGHYHRALAADQPQRFEACVEWAPGRFRRFDVQASPGPDGLLVLALASPEAPPAEAAAEELARFCHSVSHDLGAPLRHIAGFAELLESQDGGRLSERGHRHLDTIQRSARLMAEQLEQLRDLSRLGQAELHPVALDLRALIDEVRAGLESANPGPAAIWEIAPLPPVRADRALLRQALGHLLDNALKFTLSRSEPRIVIDARAEAGEISVSIHDNGIGFPPQAASRLFQPFQKLHPGPVRPGLGMGLAKVERIIRRHGGRVWGDSDGVSGATFGFALPDYSG
jgi:signal transduction histidine kinase